MIRRPLLLGLTLCLTLPAGAIHAAGANDATILAAEADTLLAKADFNAALKAYAKAAKADPDNQAHRQQYALVRRIIKMRKAVEHETNAEKWQATTQALRAFYYERKIYSEALALDQQVHAKQNTPDSAGMLAETQLELGMNAEAAGLLSGLGEDNLTLPGRLLLGIAVARQGKSDQASDIAAQCQVPDAAGPGVLFDVVRLHALTGDSEGALTTLIRCFEAVPPSRLDGFKDYAKQCQDLSTLVATADFEKALTTKSKVKESSCSGGTSCGSCPSRGKCSSSSTSSPTDGSKK